MGSGPSKKSESNGALLADTEQPGTRVICSQGRDGKIVEGFVNTTAKQSTKVEQCAKLKETTKETVIENNTLAAIKPEQASGELLKDDIKKKAATATPKKKLDVRRDARPFGKDKCLVGLDIRSRRAPSPQFLMMSKDSTRIQDASDLFALHPSFSEEFPDQGTRIQGMDMTNENIFKEVSETTTNTEASGKPENEARTKPETSVPEKKTGLSFARTSGHPSWLKPTLSDKTDKLQEGRVLSRDNFSGRCSLISGNNSYAALGPLRYGRLGLQGGVIRKELEREGLLGADGQKDPDVVLRELRQMGLIGQTSSNTTHGVDLSSDSLSSGVRLPPLESDDLPRRIAEKERRFKAQKERNEYERLEKVNKFYERQKSAKVRRERLQQQQQHEEEQQPLIDRTSPTTNADILKMKIMDVELL